MELINFSDKSGGRCLCVFLMLTLQDGEMQSTFVQNGSLDE